MESVTEFLSCEPQNNWWPTIKVLRPYIEKKVKFEHIAAQMPCMREIYGSIYDSRSDKKEVADMFFTHFEESREPGKCQEFMTALQMKYPLVFDVIKSGEINVTDKENERLIELFLIPLAELIDPERMSEMLFQRQLIEGHEKDKIHNLSKNESSYDATLYLLTKIHCRKKTWYEEFLEILWDMELQNLVSDIDDKFYTKKKGQASENLGELSFSATSTGSTDPSLDQIQPICNFELSSSSMLQNMSISAEGHDVEDSAPERRGTLEEVLTHLANISNQMTQQKNAMAQVANRLSDIERKIDQILQKP